MLKIDFISHLYHVVVNGRQIEPAPALTAMGEGTICRSVYIQHDNEARQHKVPRSSEQHHSRGEPGHGSDWKLPK